MTEITIFDHLTVGPLQCNCYIVGDGVAKKCVVIDPGDDADAIVESLASRSLEVTAIIATHAHFDHVMAAQRIREVTGAPFLLNAADRPVLDWMQDSVRMFLGREVGEPPPVDDDAADGDLLIAGGVSLEIVHTPGHSPGSISLIGPSAVFSGDTLFAGSVGRTDLPGGDSRALVDSIKSKLFELDDAMPVYPGHGPETTVGRERATNPFVGEDAGMWLPD